jgi:hypothetical protein
VIETLLRDGPGRAGEAEVVEPRSSQPPSNGRAWLENSASGRPAHPSDVGIVEVVSWKDEVAVAELVPAVAALAGGLVAVLDQLVSRGRGEHLEVR